MRSVPRAPRADEAARRDGRRGPRRPRDRFLLETWGASSSRFRRLDWSNFEQELIAPLSRSQLQDVDVCAGAVGTQAPILAHVLRSVGPSSLALNSFCASIFGLCPLPDTTPHKVELSEPPIELESASNGDMLRAQAGAGSRRIAKQWVSTGREPFQVVHISDTHVDRQYKVRRPLAACSRARKDADSGFVRAGRHRLALRQGHLLPRVRPFVEQQEGSQSCWTGASTSSGLLEPQTCELTRTLDSVRRRPSPSLFWALLSPVTDALIPLYSATRRQRSSRASSVPSTGASPFLPAASSLSAVRTLTPRLYSFAPSRSFTIFTGDAMDDAVWESYQPKIEREMHSWHDELPSRSYPVFGNHDVAPVNGFPRSTTGNASSADWVYELAAQDWERWIGRVAAEQVRTMSGCYAAVHPGTSLKIISINTNLWYVQLDRRLPRSKLTMLTFSS